MTFPKGTMWKGGEDEVDMKKPVYTTYTTPGGPH